MNILELRGHTLTMAALSQLLFLGSLLLAFIIASATAAKFPAVIVFGDSSVDSGNNNQISTLLKSNFEPYGRDFIGKRPTGRFSNGRVPPDLISEGLGLRPFVPAYLDPAYKISDFAQGVCFASAGTGYDNATSDVLNVIPLWKEVEYYKDYQKKLRAYAGETKANHIIQESLYVVSIGTNDFLENYYLGGRRSSQYTVEQFQVFLIGQAEKFVREIYALGARKISLGGLPPMGCLPLERTTNYLGGHGDGCNEEYNGVALHFNGLLNGLVKKLNKELPGIKILYADTYFVLLQIIRKPSAFGFDVASVACCGTGLFEMSYLCDRMNMFTCTDANKYVFWDSFHLTEKTNRIIVEYLMKYLIHLFN
ncbi:GDSL esterase/lipase At4g26790-like [Ipomoea triloba]|uniref:GDSL esterase/lipase At4g26790-like n=1 Tax=Ipomoea triloba TaxID=35885 RepID=UPI00125E1469|nr:GDSL esterase/lipase At4g26790-like [Ipomoea triloba]